MHHNDMNDALRYLRINIFAFTTYIRGSKFWNVPLFNINLHEKLIKTILHDHFHCVCGPWQSNDVCDGDAMHTIHFSLLYLLCGDVASFLPSCPWLSIIQQLGIDMIMYISF